jgi:hypothetical protein
MRVEIFPEITIGKRVGRLQQATELMTNNPPEGQRFDHVYVQRGEPTEDSGRMRVRMRDLAVSLSPLRQSTIVQGELGLEFVSWRNFFETAKPADILAFVTVAHRYLSRLPHVGDLHSKAWLQGVERIFAEENVRFRLDRRGGVHPRVDPEFAAITAAALSRLAAPRYANCLDSFNKSLAALAASPADGKEAIRKTFAAIEGLVRLIFPDVSRLAAGTIAKLKSLVLQAYSGERVAIEAAEEGLQSLARWIDAAHNYRHEEGKQDTVAQPPLDLAIYLVSTGASHLRWIAGLDALNQTATRVKPE